MPEPIPALKCSTRARYSHDRESRRNPWIPAMRLLEGNAAVIVQSCELSCHGLSFFGLRDFRSANPKNTVFKISGDLVHIDRIRNLEGPINVL